MMRAPRPESVAAPMEVPGVRPPSNMMLRSVVSRGFGAGGSAIPARLRCAAHVSTGALRAEAISQAVFGGRR